MKEKKKIKSGYFDIFLLTIAYIVTVAAAFFANGIHKDGSIEIGSVSSKKYVAAATTENVRETEKLREAAMEAVGPVYITDNDVMPRILDEITVYLDSADKLRSAYAMDRNVEEMPEYTELLSNENITLTQAELKTLFALSGNAFSDFRTSLTELATEVLGSGVSDVDETLKGVKEELYLSSMDNSLVGVGYDIIAGAIECNVFVDEEATNEAKQKAAQAVQPVLIQKNQKIVDENEVITEEAYYALEACGFIKPEGEGTNILPLGGKALLITFIFIGILLYFLNFNTRKILSGNEGLLLFTLYILLIISAFAANSTGYVFIPLLGILIVITLLISTGIAMIFTQVAAAIIVIVSGGEVESFLYFIAAGNIMVLMTCATKVRGKALFNGFVASVAAGLTVVGIDALNGRMPDMSMVIDFLIALGITYIYVVIAVGSMPVWEAVFGIVSDLRLSELVNPNQRLIKRLMLEAPGTYHHSLIVANLAETAAYDIGANPTLARVGAYYHDIGKLENPQYFTENIDGKSPHDLLDPFTSARVIKQHVLDGVALGKKHKLPSVILDIIYEHHGTGVIKYFYYQAKNSKKYTREIKEEDFRYPCDRPKSKEAAIIMIADTTEAAVKSLKSNGNDEKLEKMEEFVRSIIEEKIKDGQLTDSGLTIKDLETICSSIVGILKGMYHTRIAYPDDDKEEK